jgi:membrane protease YdiL (CAAX protease family)
VLAAWAWNSVEAGLCEEFFFRACLQSRLAAWLKTPVAAIVATSLLFALSHWPGLYLRGNPEVDGWSTDPIRVAAFTIATLSPLSIALGLLWARSRSLLLIVLVHGAIDALPNTAELVHIWS